jgi:hypothetical protein
MLFHNLVQYISFSTAVEQASIAVSRCLTPTDPECVQYLPAASSAPTQQWYGYDANSLDNSNIDIFATRFNYSASMNARVYLADYDTFMIRKITPQVAWNEVTVPQQTFSLALNRWENVYGTLNIPPSTIQVNYYRPIVEPVFPTNFTQDTTRDPASWAQFTSANGNVQPFSELQAIDVSQPAQGFRTFITPRVVVPILPNLTDMPSPGCLLADGHTECSSSDNANFISGQWQNYARLAIKPMALAIRRANNNSIRWDQGSFGSGAGIYVNVYNPSNVLIYTYCLGGRDEETISGNTWFNMWLRGTTGSNGGSSVTRCGVNPFSTKDNDYSNILIPRGSSFEIVGYLTVRNIDLAQVLFQYYFDQYTPATRSESFAALRCSDVLLSAKQNRPLCETANLSKCTGLQPGQLLATALPGCNGKNYLNYWTETKRLPTCSDLNGDSFAHADSMLSVSVNICDKSFSPSLIAPKGRLACGAVTKTISSSQAISIAGVPNGSCALASSNTTKTFSCTKDYVSGSIPADPKDCAGFESNYLAIINSTKDYNAKLPEGVARLSNTPSLAWAAPLTDEFKFSWTNLNDDGTVITNPQAILKRTSKLPEQDKIVRFQQVNGKWNSANPNDFVDSIIRQSGQTSNQSGWRDYLQNISNFVRVNKINETTIVFSDDYPFKEPTFELYFGQNGVENNFDFNFDCSADTTCSKDFVKYDSLEQALRAHASKKVPEALDKNFAFNFSATPVEIVRYKLEDSNLNSLLSNNSCVPTRTVCTNKTLNHNTLVDLGVSDVKPSGCDDGSYFGCYSVKQEFLTAEAPLEFKIDEELARSVGYGELQRIVRNIKADCDSNDEAGCAKISIENIDGENAIVAVNLNMPLSFPLDSFFGRKTLSLTSKKEAYIESAMVGRLSSLDITN